MAHGVNESCHPVGEVVPKHDNSTVSVELAGDDAVFGAVRDVGGDVWILDNEQRRQPPMFTLVVQDGGDTLAVSYNRQYESCPCSQLLCLRQQQKQEETLGRCHADPG